MNYLVWIDIGRHWILREDANIAQVHEFFPSPSVSVAGSFEWNETDAIEAEAGEIAYEIAMASTSIPSDFEHPMGTAVRESLRRGPEYPSTDAVDGETILDYPCVLRESIAACDRFDKFESCARERAYHRLCSALDEAAFFVGRMRKEDRCRFKELARALHRRCDGLWHEVPVPGVEYPILSILPKTLESKMMWNSAEDAFRNLSLALGYAPIFAHGFSQCIERR